MVLVEHDMRLVMKISNHILVLNFGQKLAEGNAATIAADPQVIEAYLGLEGDEGEAGAVAE